MLFRASNADIVTGMPTTAERKTLAFLAVLSVLGSAVRGVRAMHSAPEPDPADQAALRQQLAAVESARAAAQERKKSSRSRGTASNRTAPAKGPRAPATRRGISTTAVPPPAPLPLVVPSVQKVDMDVADADRMDALPRIGPVLARRIVADRDSLGPFGSLEGLQRVKGVGPSLAKTLAPHVTFSLTPRPSHVNERDPDTPRRTRRRPRPRPP